MFPLNPRKIRKNKMIDIKELKTINIFRELKEDILQKVVSICTSNTYKSNEILFEYEQPVNSLYMVLKGGIELFLPLKNNNLIKVYEAKEGETVGLSSILPDEYVATFTAKTSDNNTKLLEIDGTKLKELFNKDKDAAVYIIKSILKAYTLKKFRQTTLFISTITNHPEIKKFL